MIILGKSPCLALNEDAGSLSQKESLLFTASPRKLTRKLKKKVSCCFDDKVQGLSFDKWSFIMDSGMQITSLLYGTLLIFLGFSLQCENFPNHCVALFRKL